MQYIKVNFTREGWHRWPEAKGLRSYLSFPHRHMFHVSVAVMNVQSRRIEFHDLMDYARSCFPGGDMGAQSCEEMAQRLARRLCATYGRDVTVEVSEDGEAGAGYTAVAN